MIEKKFLSLLHQKNVNSSFKNFLRSPLKELQNYNRKVFFVSATKIAGNTTNTSAAFLRISLLFGTSNLITTFGKLNLLLINSISLVVLSVEIQRRLLQTKLYYQSFSLCLKRNISQTESSTCRKLFPTLCILFVQLASMNVFYSM